MKVLLSTFNTEKALVGTFSIYYVNQCTLMSKALAGPTWCGVTGLQTESAAPEVGEQMPGTPEPAGEEAGYLWSGP